MYSEQSQGYEFGEKIFDKDLSDLPKTIFKQYTAQVTTYRHSLESANSMAIHNQFK